MNKIKITTEEIRKEIIKTTGLTDNLIINEIIDLVITNVYNETVSTKSINEIIDNTIKEYFEVKTPNNKQFVKYIINSYINNYSGSLLVNDLSNYINKYKISYNRELLLEIISENSNTNKEIINNRINNGFINTYKSIINNKIIKSQVKKYKNILEKVVNELCDEENKEALMEFALNELYVIIYLSLINDEDITEEYIKTEIEVRIKAHLQITYLSIDNPIMEELESKNDFEENIIDNMILEQIKNIILSDLTVEEKNVIFASLGFNESDTKSFDDIAWTLDTTAENVERIYTTGINKIRSKILKNN